MRCLSALLTLTLAMPLAAQAWDLRVEAPYLHGQALPGASTTQGRLADRGLDHGQGFLLSVNHRIIRVNPVVRLDWTAEYAQWTADGQVLLGSATASSRLRQSGFGLGVNAQFWVPFTGVAGELGLIQRIQDYRYTAAGLSEDHTLNRTWLRAGLRWRFPMPELAPYVAVSYQRPLSPGHPSDSGPGTTLASHLATQGSGQEFDRLWTVGVGVQF
jgi:hypothetical protein